MKASIQRLINSPLGNQLIKALFGSAGLRLSFMFLSFVGGVLMARAMGPAGLGVYSLVMSITAILSVPTELGLPSLIMREIASARVNKDWSLMKAILIFSNKFVFIFSVIIALISLLVLNFYSFSDSEYFFTTFLLGLVLIPLVALSRLRSGALLGFEQVIRGQIPEMILRPGILALLLGGWLLYTSDKLTPDHVMLIQVVSTVVAFLFGTALLLKAIPKECSSAIPKFKNKEWIKSSLPMALTEGVRFIQGHIAIILLGWFAVKQDVGLYKVASQLAELVALPLGISNLLLSPFISRFYTEKNESRLKKLIAFGTIGTSVSSIIIFAAFYFIGDSIITLLFGHEYQSAYTALLVLGLGQTYAGLTGPTGAILNMTRYESKLSKAFVYSLVLSVIAGFILIPTHGLVGAAISTITGIIVWKTITCYYVRKYLNIEPTILCLWTERRNLI